MSELLRGKTALVTGASRGIGLAIAQRLAAEGATILLAARPSGALDDAVRRITAADALAIPLAIDLGDDEQVAMLPRRAEREAGGVDILVNNGGAATYAPFAHLPADAIDRMFRLYVRAPILLARAVLPMMKSRGEGWIVNIGSITALPPARPYTDASKAGADIVYAAAKAALLRFTLGLAATTLADRVAVNMVSPSTAIRTPGADALLPETYPTERVEYLAETVLAMCHRPASERTGLTAFSMHYPWATGLPVHSLDGRETLPVVEPPRWRHPATPEAGDELCFQIPEPA
jgi:NAD(P)-dependent dehydrogenase (short-subunit alcohol dehydrogenase family)